jgi:Na+/H+-dicarboxylate symporter
VRQLWFWVLIAIALGIVFGLGNSVATIVIAKWQGELDEEQFHAALDEPATVDHRTERALGGAVAA